MYFPEPAANSSISFWGKLLPERDITVLLRSFSMLRLINKSIISISPVSIIQGVQNTLLSRCVCGFKYYQPYTIYVQTEAEINEITQGYRVGWC